MEPASPELSWVSDARVAGFESFEDDPDVDARFDALAASHVSVVVVDTDLSFYVSEGLFEESAVYIDAEMPRARYEGGERATQPEDTGPAETPFTHKDGLAVLDVTVNALLLAGIAVT